MTDIQPGMKFSHYNGSGYWGTPNGVINTIVFSTVSYTLTSLDGETHDYTCSVSDFQKLISDGYVELTK